MLQPKAADLGVTVCKGPVSSAPLVPPASVQECAATSSVPVDAHSRSHTHSASPPLPHHERCRKRYRRGHRGPRPAPQPAPHAHHCEQVPWPRTDYRAPLRSHPVAHSHTEGLPRALHRNMSRSHHPRNTPLRHAAGHTPPPHFASAAYSRASHRPSPTRPHTDHPAHPSRGRSSHSPSPSRSSWDAGSLSSDTRSSTASSNTRTSTSSSGRSYHPHWEAMSAPFSTSGPPHGHTRRVSI